MKSNATSAAEEPRDSLMNMVKLAISASGDLPIISHLERSVALLSSLEMYRDIHAGRKVKEEDPGSLSSTASHSHTATAVTVNAESQLVQPSTSGNEPAPAQQTSTAQETELSKAVWAAEVQATLQLPRCHPEASETPKPGSNVDRDEAAKALSELRTRLVKSKLEGVEMESAPRENEMTEKEAKDAMDAATQKLPQTKQAGRLGSPESAAPVCKAVCVSCEMLDA